MSNSSKSRQQLLDLMDKLGINVDLEALAKADAAQSMLEGKPSMSKVFVRRALISMVMFIHDNRETILPYAKTSFALIAKEASDNEMLAAYLRYMLEDFVAGADSLYNIAKAQGFDRAVEIVKERTTILDKDIADNGGESAIAMI